MAITISGENNNDRILAQDGVIDQISGINIVGLITSSHINVGSNIQLGNAGIITATTFVGNLTGNVNNTSPLLLQTGGSERFRITGNNELGIAGANYGSSGQVLTSGGSGSAVSWTTIPTQVTIANNADNRVITGGSGVNLNGEANLVFDGSSLGVGTNNPSNALDVQAGTTNTAIVARSTDAKAQISLLDNSTTSVGSVVIGAEGDDLFLTSGSGGAEALRITSDGRVLIGRTSAYAHADADNLIVGNEATNEHQGITILSHSGKYGGIYFGDGAGTNPNNRCKIIYDHPNDQLRIGTGGAAATQFYINSSGYVGINQSPSTRLDVKQDNGVAYNNRAQSLAYNAARFLNTSGHTSGGTYTGFQFNITGDSQNRICAIGMISEASNSRNSSLVFATDDNSNRTEKVRINSSGYVGVGENTPATILHVKANVGDLLRLDRNNTGAVGNQIAFRHSNSGTLTETGSINCVSTANAATGELRFYTKASGASNSEKLRITSNGKVNIGTGELDQTDRMLNIYGGRARISGITAGNSFEIYASNTSGQSYGILCQAGTGSSDINTALRNTSGVSLFRVRGDGVVFVGSSTVQQGSTSKLEVMGTLNNSYPNYSYPLMVSDDAAYNSSGGPGGGIGFSFKQNSGGAYAQAGGIRGVKENTTDGDYASALLFYTRANGAGTVEQVRINSRGQLNLGGGLGGTNTRNFTHLFNMHPLSNPAGALWNYNNNNVYLGQNIYFTGQYQRDQAAASSYFQQEGGKHKFYTAASGTAGAACTPYQTVAFEPNNIPSSLSYGNRPSYKGNLLLFGSSSATSQGGIEFHTSGGGGAGYGSRITASADGSLAFHVRNNNSAWMTPLQYIWNGDLSWGENPNNTLYDEGSNHGAYYRRQQGSFQFATKSSSGWSNVYLNKNTSGGTSDYRWIDFYWNSSSRGQITWNGSNVVYGGASDYRLKENVVDITDGISRVKQLQPRRFNWINDPTKNTQDGFIAHEVQSVIPIAVTGTKDKVVTQEEFNNDTQPEDKEVGTPIYQQMDYGKVTPLLTAAVKELIAKVETLEAEVAALKG